MHLEASQMSSFLNLTTFPLEVVVGTYHQEQQSRGKTDKSWDIFPLNMFRMFEFCGSAENWNGIIFTSFLSDQVYSVNIFLWINENFSWLAFSFSS